MTPSRKGILPYLSSIRLAVILLILIALGALLGTVIPQREAAGAFVGRLSPTVLALFEALRLFDVYRSPWFILLLLLLAVNLTACSLERFPAVWRQLRAAVNPDQPDRFADPPPDHCLALQSPPAETVDRLVVLLEKRFGPVRRVQTDRGTYLAAQKGAFARLGVYGVHLGILLLIAGGLVGGLWGVKGQVQIAEGETSDTLHLAGGKGSRPLGFQIRCDRFVVEHYDSGAPKVFRSDLAFLADGKVEKEGALLVNHPLDFGGLRFYQASYGRLSGGVLSLSWSRGAEMTGGREVRPGDRFSLPGGAGEVEVLRVEDNLMRMGPAVKLTASDGAKRVEFWVFQNIAQIVAANPGLFEQVPLMNPDLFAPWRFSLAKSGERYYTVLQAARDPGAPLVALGAALMIVGLIVVFFFAHRRLWAEVTARKDGSRIVIAGQTSRDPAGLESEIQRLLAAVGAAEELS
jgi:cytochrome c biogenesis protein